MKISANKLAAFNAGKESKYNENYNASHGLPNMIEATFLRYVHDTYFGVIGGKVTQKHIADYLEKYGFTVQGALLKHAQQNNIRGIACT